jgi:hypothetical protein
VEASSSGRGGRAGADGGFGSAASRSSGGGAGAATAAARELRFPSTGATARVVGGRGMWGPGGTGTG